MPDPNAQNSRRCCCSMSPNSVSSKNEDVFPAGTRTQIMHIRYIYTPIYKCIHAQIYTHTYTHGWPHKSQKHAQSTHTNKDSCDSRILLPSLAGQDGSPIVKIYICTRCMQDPSSSLSSSWPLDPSLPSC